MAWERVVPWKVLSMVARPEGPPVPVGFGARSPAFHDLLEPGSRIWVVTRIANVHSLAAKVTVRELLDRNDPHGKWPEDLAGLLVKWRFVARADPTDSAFFETNDAGPVIDELGIRFAQNRTVAYRDAPLEQAFRRCVEQARKTVFLSYRWSEGRRFAIALARALRERGWSPWLDALSIPGYQARRDPGVDAPRLRKLIEYGIENSSFAVVINTETFAKASWTRLELERIRSTGIPWFQVMRGGRERPCDEPPISARGPDAVAQEILRRRALHAADGARGQAGPRPRAR
jgi:hypothetical protein